MMRRFTVRQGFSLLELSIVIGIIALLAGAGMNMASGALKAADRISTQERLNTIKLALDSFAKTYGYLPCPAARNLITSDASFGVEKRGAPGGAGVGCTVNAGETVQASNVVYGVVPVRTLGLPDHYAGDAWGNKLTYAVSLYLTDRAINYSNNDGALTITYGVPSGSAYGITNRRTSTTYSAAANNGAGLVRLTVASSGSMTSGSTIVHVASSTPSTGYKGSYVATVINGTTIDLVGSTYSATDAGTLIWQYPGTAAAYAVISHGPDGRGAYPMAGTAIPGTKLCNTSATANTSPPPCTSSATTTCIDIQNCNDSDATLYSTAYNDGTTAAQYFDDYVVWGSNSNMRPAVNATLYSTCGTGACEAWCAACSLNYPAGGAAPGDTAPPAIITSAVLCKKVLTSDATNCRASCFWSGSNANGKGAASVGFQKCP